MRKISKMLMTIMFAVVVTFGLIPVVPVEAAAITKESETIVMYQKNQECTVYFSDVSAANAKKSGVKSSNKKVATLVAIDNNEYSYEDSGENMSSHSYNCGVRIKLKKPGTTTITCKTGGKTYKKKVIIKKYVNPVSSVTITGVNRGKNIAGKTRKKNYVNFKGAKCESSKITVVPKKGWTLESISFSCYDTGESFNQSGKCYNEELQKDVIYNTLNIGKLVKSNTYSINLNFVNSAGVREVVGYEISNTSKISGIY